ncbi:MAG TPA: NAD(P)H-binding protein [Trichormus sp.]|jgi:NADH dehydrogenase
MAVVAITGGTGFIGSHLAYGLLARGHKVKLIARGITRRDDPLRKEPNVSFVPTGLTEERQLFAAFGGCDAVCHLTGINRERQKDDFDKIHRQGTISVVNAATQAQVKKLVYVSYLRARDDRMSGYLRSKWQAEEIVRHSTLDYTVVKPGMVYGHGDQMIASVVDGLDGFPLIGVWPTVGLLEKPVNPIFIDDFVKILVAALVENRLARQTVAVIGPENISLTKAAFRIASVMKKPVMPLPMPILGQYMLATFMEKTMKEPIVCVSQIRMLSEGMNRPQAECDPLPEDLLPQTKFTEQSIRQSYDF